MVNWALGNICCLTVDSVYLVTTLTVIGDEVSLRLLTENEVVSALFFSHRFEISKELLTIAQV